jgi:YbbR domain-containing protein
LISDEISVVADLRGLPMGEHMIELQAIVDPIRHAIVTEIAPRRLRVVLEARREQRVPVQALIVQDLPAGYERGEPIFETPQVLVSGAASAVDNVVSARVVLDLSNVDSTVRQTLVLAALDAQGQVIPNVELNPAQVTLSVDVQRRADVREIAISPFFLEETLPQGYILTALSYTPQSVLVTGPPQSLAALEDVLRTQPIDLTNRTSDFEVTTTVDLPSDDLVMISGEQVTVSVGIAALTASRNFENIPVEIVGLPATHTGTTTPSTVTVLISGPQTVVNALQTSDVRVFVDANGLSVGIHTRTPSVNINQTTDGAAVLTTENISLLPNSVEVQISTVTATPTPRTTPSRTPTPSG